MKDLVFKCFECRQDSEFRITSQNRDTVLRLHSSGERSNVTFICGNCGTANEIKITLEQATRILERIDSNNPEVRKAIDQAKAGDYSQAFDLARKKLGF